MDHIYLHIIFVLRPRASACPKPLYDRCGQNQIYGWAAGGPVLNLITSCAENLARAFWKLSVSSQF